MSEGETRPVAALTPGTESVFVSGDTPGSSLPSAVPPPTAPVLPAIPGYEVLGELGRGGMGVVYKARHLKLDRVVALKMILAGAYAGPEDVEVLRKEAAALGRLQHPNIVQIFEVGEAGGAPFFALEFVEGGGLDRKLAGAPQDPREAAALVETLARAVHAAHQRRVVHRDLKPQNILLAADGTPKITDFGLAKRLDEEGRTASGAVLGTPSYMAPEQARGRPGEIGPAVDVYALGAILYQLLTGRPPFRAETPLDTMLQVLTHDAPPPRQLRPDVPRDLETICLTCLNKEPRRRYATAAALADDLRRFLERRPIVVRRVGAVERLALWAQRRPEAAAAVGLLVLAAALGAGGGAAVWFWRGAEQARGQAVSKKAEADAARVEAEGAKQKAVDARVEAEGAKQKAEAARGETEKARQDLAAANDKIDQTSYLFKVDLAYRDLLNLDFGRCDRMLDECPPARRQWEWGFVRSLRDACVTSFRLPAETPLASSMTTTPDGARLAVAWGNGAVQVWDLKSRKMEVAWTVEARKPPPVWRSGSGVTSLAFSRDGKRLAGAPGDDTIRVWDAATGKEEYSFEGDPGEFSFPAFSPDGSKLAAPLMNGPVKVWDLASGKEEHSLKGDDKDSSYDGVIFSTDGKRLAAASFHDVAMWDLGDEKVLLHRDEGKDVIVSPETLFFGADGDAVNYVTLASGVAFNVLRVGKDDPERKVDCGGLRDSIVALAPDGRRLVILDKDGDMTLWDLAPGREAAAARWTADKGSRFFGHLAFSTDGARLIDAADDDVHVWDTGKSYPERQLAGRGPPISSLVFSRDGARLAAGGDFGVRAWDARDGRTWAIDTSAQKAGLFSPHPDGRPLAFSPDGGRLLVPDAEALRVWDLDAGKEERALDVGGAEVTAVAWAADGRITALTDDGVVRVWGKDPKPERTWTCEDGKSSESRLSADGALLLTGLGQRSVWDLREGRLIQRLNGSERLFGSTALSADGRRAAESSVDLETQAVRVTVWDRDKPDAMLTVDVGDADPAPKDKSRVANAVALSPDGRRLAVALKDGTVQLWDVDAGREALVTRAHGSERMALAFSADGRVLACMDALGDVTLLSADAAPK